MNSFSEDSDIPETSTILLCHFLHIFVDSIAVSVFVFILIDFGKYTIRNKYTKKSDCEMSWLVYIFGIWLKMQ